MFQNRKQILLQAGSQRYLFLNGYEVDGIEMQLPDSAIKNYYKMPLRAMMEKGLERRIRHVKVLRNNKLWITLWQKFSKFDVNIYRCINRYVDNLKRVCDGSVSVNKIDLKVDHEGSFIWPLRGSRYPSLFQKAVKTGVRW